ncbi:MAG: substrate-binding domain-containing protein [Candidatus Bipolaricaulota bacterium]
MFKNQQEKHNSGLTNNWSLGLSLGIVLALIVSFALISPITSAQEDGTTLPKETIDKIESIDKEDFVYIFCNPLDDLRVTKIIEGAMTPTKLFDLDVKFFGPEEPYDAEAIHTILEGIISQSPRGIAMEIGHPSKFDKIIGEAVDRGIYFISFSVDDWTANPRQGYVGYDWPVEGKKLTDELFEDMPPRSRILVLDSETKRGRSYHGKLQGVTRRLNAFNIDYSILNVKPSKDDIERALLENMKGDEVDGIISLWGELTKPLSEVIDDNELHSVRAGGFGCGDFEKFVKSGSLDVLMKVVTELEGGIPLENLYYSSLYKVTPSTIQLHARLISGSK